MKENVKVHLKPSAQLVSEIVQTKTLNVGDSVSYGSTYTATEPTRIAVLPIGYADGYLRSMIICQCERSSMRSNRKSMYGSNDGQNS